MRSELARLRERLVQDRAGLRAGLGARVTSAAAGAAPRSSTLVPGDRVFDTQTGEEGIVEHGYRENILRATAER
jgi:hypothetical protein